jgi:hypothetical protein
MSKSLIIVLVVLVGILVLGGTSCGVIIGVNNGLVRQENDIIAQYKDNQNNYDNMWKKFQEAAQVPAMYTEDMKKVFDSAITSRYGAEGSKALFQMIKEQNPNFDASLYAKLQAMIEAGRNSFQAAQTTILDKCRVYTNDLEVFPNSFVAGFLGFPKKIDEDVHCKPVTSERTENVFKTKKDEAVKLR